MRISFLDVCAAAAIAQPWVNPKSPFSKEIFLVLSEHKKFIASTRLRKVSEFNRLPELQTCGAVTGSPAVWTWMQSSKSEPWKGLMFHISPLSRKWGEATRSREEQRDKHTDILAMGSKKWLKLNNVHLFMLRSFKHCLLLHAGSRVAAACRSRVTYNPGQDASS